MTKDLSKRSLLEDTVSFCKLNEIAELTFKTYDRGFEVKVDVSFNEPTEIETESDPTDEEEEDA